MNNSANILVGLLITCIALTAVSGNVSVAVTILIYSVICTAGISLVIWVPIFWIVGGLTIAITAPLYSLIARWAGWRRIEAPVSLSEQSLSLTPEHRALVDYTKKARAKGMSDTQIASRLTAQGWTNEEIELAQQIASERQ